ncbi:MAG: hypothetical protein Q8M03_04770 [Legionella sp.]|nr:hypothetical protein [Legionella sp.]
MKFYTYWLCALAMFSQSAYPGASSQIWFFSPKGVQVTEGDVINQCTAERPCRELTQDFVNNLNNFLTLNQLKGKLWLATGVYDLPANPKQNQAPMLDLYRRISIAGRTPDFKHIAYNDERPLINGTLSWNDYSHHGGTEGSVRNIRMHTNENPIQVENTFVNANIHSTGNLEVINSALQKTTVQNGENIHANFIRLIDSTLSSTGENAVNIASQEGLYSVNSRLRVRGFGTHNLQIAKGSVDVYKSDLETDADSCPLAMNFTSAIEAESSIDLNLASSHIVMNSTVKCPLGSMTAIVAPASPYISILDSSILLKSIDEDVTAIENSYFSVKLTNSKINIESSNGKAYAFRNYHTTLAFTGKPSTIHVSSPILATLYLAPEIIRVSNQSTPLSQCKINKESSVDC